MRFFGRKKKEKEERREEKQSKKGKAEKPYIEYEGSFLKIVGHIEDSTEIEKSMKEPPESSGFFIEEIAPGHYKIKPVASSTKASETEHSDTKEEKEEKKEAEPLNRDEILLEILKELKELNSSVKAMIVRMDVSREEIRELIGYAVDRIEGRIISSGGC